MSNTTASSQSLIDIQNVTMVQKVLANRSRVDIHAGFHLEACAIFIPQPKADDLPVWVAHFCHSSQCGSHVCLREPS